MYRYIDIDIYIYIYIYLHRYLHRYMRRPQPEQGGARQGRNSCSRFAVILGLVLLIGDVRQFLGDRCDSEFSSSNMVFSHPAGLVEQ